MLLNTWSNGLVQSFSAMSSGVVSFVPNIVVAIIIFIAGWVIGVVVGRVIAQIIRSVKLDSLLRQLGVDELTRRAGVPLDSGVFLGALCKWFIIIAFLVASLSVLNLNQVTVFLSQTVLNYLPNVIVAVLILLVASVIADTVGRTVLASAKAAQVAHAGFLGTVVRWAIWIFAIIAALYQLQVAQAIIAALFNGIVIAISLALGLSFGLGGQHAAARYLDKVEAEMKARH